MKNINWDNVQEATRGQSLAPGGYICGILTAEDVPKKEYLRMEFDIAEGAHKNHFRQLKERTGWDGWPYEGSFVRSYKEKARPFFKAFITALELSNKGYKFNNDEHTLPRKLFGAVLAEEEYRGNDGKVKTRLYVYQIRSVKSIREGDFTVPEKKRLTEAEPAYPAPGSFAPVTGDDDDVPF